jgi:hypothetical protein
MFLGAYVILSILASVFSWYDYRKEEVKLSNDCVEQTFRKAPSLRNFWRWQETYFILFMIVVIIFAYAYVEYQIIPLIK